jgi:predicted GNAT family N-acyltransferase
MGVVSLSDALEWEKTLGVDCDLRGKFDSGEPSLNTFLQNFARKSDKENISRPWILIDEDKKQIAGYITLSNTSIDKIEVVDQFKTNVNPIPALLIGRLAIDKNYQGHRLGEKLLMFGLQKVKEINQTSAIQLIVVDALSQDAEKFYSKYGFVKVGAANKMILSVKKLFEA